MLLLGELGLTRAEAQAFRSPPSLPRRGEPFECPSCLRSRWLRVVGPAWVGDRGTVRDLLDPRGADVTVHDCMEQVDDLWRSAPTLLPAIDRHGWVNPYRPLSMTALANIAEYRQQAAELPPGPVVVLPATGRFADATSAELTAAFDDIDARLDALIAATEAAMAEPSQLSPERREPESG